MDQQLLHHYTNWRLLEESCRRNPGAPALEGSFGSHRVSWTYAEWRQRSLALANYLDQQGLNAGDRIAIVSTNRLEWYVVDMALSRLGLVNVSLFPNYSPEDFAYILKDAEPAAVICADRLLHSLLKAALSQASSSLRYCWSFDPFEGWPGLRDYMHTSGDAGQLLPDIPPPDPEAIYTLFYTSGTGGPPKGVITLQRGIAAAAISMARALELTPEDKGLSFLSVSHAYERGHYLSCVYAGASLSMAEPGLSPEANLAQRKPTYFTSVPLLLSRMVGTIQADLSSDTEREAMQAAEQYEPGEAMQSPSNQYPEIYAKWKTRFGGKLRVLSCAGAPLPPKVARFFWAIGIPLQEVYGLSECFSVTYARRSAGVRLGTVGPPAEFAEVRIAEDGEILFRGPFLMAGFYRLPELTNKVLNAAGWLHTGDLGEWVDDRFIRIVGRKKDQFKIASGNYVHPGTVEEKLLRSDWIAQAVVFEKDGRLAVVLQPFPSAINTAGWNALSDRESILEQLRSEVDYLYNRHVLEPEQIADVYLAETEWGILTGELTPNMKVRRQKVIAPYQ